MTARWIVFFLFPIIIPGLTQAASDRCDTATVLTQIRPGAAWTIQSNSMKKLTWLDTKQNKPSEAEVEKAKQACISNAKTRDALKAQARFDVKNPAVPVEKKVEQLILLLDLDK